MPSSPQSVLVVDDEPTIRVIARAALAGAGYAVTEAADAAAALAAVRDAAEPFGVVLLDLSLPGESGVDLIPELRRATPESRVLVVSGLIEEDAAGLGADGFVGKPFTRARLLEAVRQALGG